MINFNIESGFPPTHYLNLIFIRNFYNLKFFENAFSRQKFIYWLTNFI